MLCGLKLDLLQPRVDASSSTPIMKRQIPIDQAYAYAERYNLTYIEISSKTGHNVEEVFYKIADKINE